METISSNSKIARWDMAVAITKTHNTMHLPATLLLAAMFLNNSSSSMECRLASRTEETKEGTSLRIMKLSDREFSQAATRALRQRKAQSNFITHQVDVQTSNCSDMYKRRVIDPCLKFNEVRVYIRV